MDPPRGVEGLCVVLIEAALEAVAAVQVRGHAALLILAAWVLQD